MGTQFCKTTPLTQDHHQGFEINPPQLSAPIIKYLTENRIFITQTKEPFQKQLSLQKSTSIKSYPDGVYQGPLNIVHIYHQHQLSHPSGYGRLYKTGGSIFVGQFSNGKANGQGVLVYPNGSYAKGYYEDNFLIDGQYVTQGFKYTGEFKNNLFHGLGEETNITDGYEFSGRYNQGHKQQGTMKWKQGKIQYTYEGKFSPQGLFLNGGKLTEQSLGYYIGQYKQNKKHGKGMYEYLNGIKYVGDYVEGNKEGYGILYNGDGSASYEGWFKNGLPHGMGKAFNKEGTAVEADWIEGINKELISS